LLAYNNAVFTEKDFESLSRLGDSLKLQDGLTTGKFGRGFNSVGPYLHINPVLLTLQVYNWTDSPSIISENLFLILDPHEEWSPGGNKYDFVKDSQDIEIQNSMAAFQSVMDDPTKPFDGTIIRIPLRTPEQARKSDISNREPTVMEIHEVLEKFAAEFGNSGLLFMKNILKVSIDSTAGMSIVIEIVGGEDVRT
jgi:sacsin